jgi:EAL and modified HD-GYP domain-containing signal transduction protein
MEKTFEEVFIGKQPIFDAFENIWGYELLYRSSGSASCAQIEDGDIATSKVISDGVLLIGESLQKFQKLMINFTESLLTSGAVFALPPETCIIEILENVGSTPQVLSSISYLAKSKFTFALDDFTGQIELEPFLPHVKIVKIDILQLNNLGKISQLVGKLRKFDVKLIAEKVEDKETFNALKSMGFDLFQGYFFSRPEVIPGRKISAHHVAKINILAELGSDELDFNKISEIIKTDTSISYRLLKYVNLVGVNPGCRINSIERAVTILGRRQLVQWLRAVILSDLNPSMKASELSFMAVNRGFFLEIVAVDNGCCSYMPETMFLIGMFSLINVILQIPIETILYHLPLNDSIKRALIDKQSAEYMWIDLSHSYERWDIARVKSLTAVLSLDFEKTTTLFKKAFKKTHDIMAHAASSN